MLLHMVVTLATSSKLAVWWTTTAIKGIRATHIINGGGNGHFGNLKTPYKDHQCQVCGKFGHTALRCSDDIHTANGAGMMIKHVGHSTISTPSCHIFLNTILHVLQAARNLVSMHRLTSDNNVFPELHPIFLLSRIGT
jgi:hypothetical protein